MQRSLWAAGLAALVLTISASLTVVSCGGSSPGSPTPTPTPTTPTPTPTPTPPTSAEVRTTTITITSTGVSPKQIVVARGSRVTFVNSDAPHDMNSDPHPIHTECPEINVGFFGLGQSAVSRELTTVRTCSYHDHNQPTNVLWQGSIRIE